MSGDRNPFGIWPVPTPFTLGAATVISASLITGQNSSLRGVVTAQITEHVYDAATGRTLLVPQGSRLPVNAACRRRAYEIRSCLEYWVTRGKRASPILGSWRKRR
jgi:hypothetical protein